MRIIDHHILLVLWLWNVKYCFCSFAHTWVVSSWSVQPPQIRVRSHQLIKILTGDSYTYELCIWHSIVLYPMLQNYCMFKHSKGCILNLAGPILRFWRKYVFGNVWHCTKQNPSKKVCSITKSLMLQTMSIFYCHMNFINRSQITLLQNNI